MDIAASMVTLRISYYDVIAQCNLNCYREIFCFETDSSNGKYKQKKICIKNDKALIELKERIIYLEKHSKNSMFFFR